MKLYLMRHAEAEDGPQLDPTRKLTSIGKRQAKMMARWLNRQTEKPDLVIESNMRRSHQTARRVAERIDCEIVRTFAIDPDSTPEAALDAMIQIGKGSKSVIAVSHGPLVEEILAYITGGAPANFHFAHAAVAHFELNGTKAIEAKGEYYYDEIEQKRWVIGGTGCELCEDNADLGWIDMDDVFDGVFGDVDEAPAHPNCDCSVEFKTRRIRIYASERTPPKGTQLRESAVSRPAGLLHWLVTPNTVARDEDELENVTEDAFKVAESAAALVACII